MLLARELWELLFTRGYQLKEKVIYEGIEGSDDFGERLAS
jgi:hypothetical protein